MIRISFRDGRPIYEQVRDGYRQMIITSVLPAGSKLPSVREVAASLAINPNTIQRAYRELEAEGYIISVPGKGSFVSDRSDAIRARCEELKGSFRTMVKELRQTGAEENELTEIVREEFRHD